MFCSSSLQELECTFLSAIWTGLVTPLTSEWDRNDVIILKAQPQKIL